ncbi:HAMP domain-containing sensor histidine kinase [Oleiagrimonas sp. C23AA]|uniref:HAMP domain-containing sensor histidine kinase n=1 Tax=Oleiagrimonas sp. C23AA TaxID=2719047 RepID=UPI0014203748|nr:HAMP domain-containing sensor histidine kinase [Oleiagrimonas sp. C23AA]NII10571.1 two-component sensor histidine kinase [Oleiagrimonas sp. C23AA]
MITIRSVLVRALVGMLVGVIVVMGALTFFEFRGALQAEIARNLQFGASAVMQRLDVFVASQMESLRVWRKLEVMQDLRVDDVDKRLSHFLSDLQAGQDSVYRALMCTDMQGRVVAASRAELIGSRAPHVDTWTRLPGSTGQGVFIGMAMQDGHHSAILRTRIPNAFGSGDIGRLYAWLDWRAVRSLLDAATANSPRGLLLLSAHGDVIAASRGLRGRVSTMHGALKWPLPAYGASSYVHDGGALGYDNLLVGAATSSGYQQFKGLNWHILMLEPTSVSFRPVWHLLWAMAALLATTLLMGVWLSSRLAGRIARPVIELTQFTRRFRQGEAVTPAAPASSVSEVDELARAYAEMIGALEQSRLQVVRAGKLAVVGEMAAIMAHEVRTPMGIVRSSAQLLGREMPAEGRERELIGFILSETERLNRLVTMLLECARPKPPDFRFHDLNDIVHGVVELMTTRAEHAGITLQHQALARQAVLSCDREQMMQLVLNLVLNALEFVSAGGHIVITTEQDGPWLDLRVADDGPGVAEELCERIFDPFFSRREGGIGLGLTIVQQIVQAHGGCIEVGRGALGGAEFAMRFSVDTEDTDDR